MSVVEEVDLADVWRDTQDPRWKDVHEQMQGLFELEARKDKRIGRIKDRTERENHITALFSEFWCHLMSNRQVLEGNRIRGIGAIRNEMRRFLWKTRLGDKQGSIEDRKQKFLHHLQSEKVIPVLKKEPDYHTISGKNYGPWMLECWKKEKPKNVFRSDDDLCRILPSVPADLVYRRSDQDVPPLVALDDLHKFLLTTLETAGRAIRSWDLTVLAWKKLEPSPITVFPLQAEEMTYEDGSTKDYADNQVEHEECLDDWRCQVDIVATQLLDQLSERTQQILMYSLFNTDQTKIAKKLGISRGTVHNELKKFKSLLKVLTIEKDLDEKKCLILLEIIKDRLRTEFFMSI